MISIHAPPRGATRAMMHEEFQRMISIHAPPRGATRLACLDELLSNISIHAPPRGATTSACDQPCKALFQFTPLREGRRFATGGSSCSQHYFNSRPSARGDVHGREKGTGTFISIHAPPRGATLTSDCYSEGVLISIHAPPRGATRALQHSRQLPLISIHAPPRGATVHNARYLDTAINFNSRPSARGDEWFHRKRTI